LSRQEREAKEGALNTSFPAILLRRFGCKSPARPLSPAPPWPYETRPCRSASARCASFGLSGSCGAGVSGAGACGCRRSLTGVSVGLLGAGLVLWWGRAGSRPGSRVTFL